MGRVRVAVLLITILCASIVISREMLLAWYLQHKFKFRIDSREAVAIGIIGGADGPTNIYIVSKLLTPSLLLILKVVAAAGLVFLILTRGRSF